MIVVGEAIDEVARGVEDVDLIVATEVVLVELDGLDRGIEVPVGAEDEVDALVDHDRLAGLDNAEGAEVQARVELLRGPHLAAVIVSVFIPAERFAEPVVHADVQVQHDEDRGLQPIGQIKSLGAHFEALAWVFRKQQHVFGVAVRSVSTAQQVRLLRSGRHAGGRTAALHVKDDRWNFSKVGEAQRFLHQRDARPGGCGKRARAIPGRADDHSNRGELVLCLHDRVACRLGVGLAGCSRVRLGHGHDFTALSIESAIRLTPIPHQSQVLSQNSPCCRLRRLHRPR